MEKFIVTTGKTIDLAVAAALAQLQMDRDSVSVEVLENAKSGFLGIGSSPAKVKVTYEAPDESAVSQAPKAALSSASRSKPKERPEITSSIISRPGKKIEPEEQPKKEPRRERRNDRREKQPRTGKPEKPANSERQENAAHVEHTEKGEKAAAPKQPSKTAAAQPKEYAPAAPGSVEECIEQFLTGLLKHMGSDAVPHAYCVGEDSYRAELVGKDVGLLIGRRGDTLDAIQYLTSYAVNRDKETRVRISVDARVLPAEAGGSASASGSENGREGRQVPPELHAGAHERL